MARTRSRRTIPDSPVNSTDPRVNGALLQLMRVLVDIAGNTPSADAGDPAEADPAVRGDDWTHAAPPAVSPHSEGTHSRGCSAQASRLVEKHATSRELTETSLIPVRAEEG